MTQRSGTAPLIRPMAQSRPTEWVHARWIGSIDLEQLDAGIDSLPLQDAEGFRTARFLIRSGAAVLGFVEAPIVRGAVRTDLLRAESAALPAAPATEPEPADTHLPTITVVLCTRDRPELLEAALTSIDALDYPRFDVVVVDNASTTAETAQVAERHANVRLVREPIAGLARARNTGLAAASGALVAFTDDDVIVDPGWLRGIARGFRQADGVDCVTGLVPSGELATAVQGYFDERVSWSRIVRRRVFRQDAPPADLPLFPFSVGEFGTGANFALRRDAAAARAGFDPVFGVGTRTQGGEDLDMFLRVLRGGGALVVEPSALVWHRHRADLDGLARQARGYGLGLGAWLTKIALTPGLLVAALARAPHAVRVLSAKRAATATATATGAPARFPAEAFDAIRTELEQVARIESRAVFAGPLAYLRERRAAR